MKSSLLRRASFILCLVLNVPVYAAVDIGYLKSLVDKHDFKTAYSYAIKHIEENEGDPEFDYLFGMAAIDTGEISKGIFSLERVLIIQPDNHVARLELARAYFLLGEDLRARQEFNTVLKQNPPSGVQATIKQFISAIKLRETRYKTTAKAYIETSLGYDTNTNGGPSSGEFSSPTFGEIFSLNKDDLRQSDAFYQMKVGGVVSAPVAPGEYLTMGYDISYRGHKDVEAQAFDTKIFNTYAIGSILDENSKYSFGGQINVMYQGDQQLRTILGLSGEWKYKLASDTDFTLSGRLSKYHYTEQIIKDATSVIIGTGLTRRYEGSMKPVVFGYLSMGRDLAAASGSEAAAVADRTVYGVSTGIQLMLTPDFSLSGSLSAQKIGYGEAGFFGKIRKDDLWSATLSSNWLFMQDWSLRTDINFIENDSNIGIYNYDKTEGQISVRHDFQ